MTIDELRACHSYADLENLFGIPAAKIAKALYGPHPGYSSFAIPKRSGGTRLIESPSGVRRQMQRQLAPLLAEAYKPNPAAHGFLEKRSVASNATPHIGRRTLVNIDLENFFHSISFRRVRGIFLAKPFELSWQTSNILAQLCCCDGRLPAGGITSPALSNLALTRLDKRMSSLASRFGGTYTRYADDLTFSFDRSIDHIQGVTTRTSLGTFVIGHQVLEVITSEGFSSNPEKFRVAQKDSRKIVTGLVVNVRRNVRRKWLTQLRSTIHAMRKFGASSVANRLYPDIDQGVAERMLLRKVHGRLAYLSMVRGKGDWIASDLAWKFNAVSTDPRLKIPDVELISESHRVARCILVVTASHTNEPDFATWDEQGTAFVTERGLIVTAAHALRDENDTLYKHVWVRTPQAAATRYPCIEIYSDLARDISVLRLIDHNASLVRARLKIGGDLQAGQHAFTYGFPAYSVGHQCSQQDHEVTGSVVAGGVKKLTVTGTIIGGLSGGPALNSDHEIVGVVHRGLANGGFSNQLISSHDLKIVLANV